MRKLNCTVNFIESILCLFICFFFKISYLNYVIRILFSVKFIWRINEPQKSWHVSLYLLFETDYEDDFDIRPATKKTVEGKELFVGNYIISAGCYHQFCMLYKKTTSFSYEGIYKRSLPYLLKVTSHCKLKKKRFLALDC